MQEPLSASRLVFSMLFRVLIQLIFDGMSGENMVLYCQWTNPAAPRELMKILQYVMGVPNMLNAKRAR